MPPSSSMLLIDLYELYMTQAYVESGMMDTAVFEFFIRRLPSHRGFLLAAGLERALQYLENAEFSSEDLHWLKNTGEFSPDFLDYLATFRFTGDVDAMPEGTVFFADEPIFRVTAPLPEAQMFETRLINILHFETLVASKAARMVLAASGRTLVDFGLRRAHGAATGLAAARAAYIAGFDGTSTVLAKPQFGMPIFGTMAHSFVQAHETEDAAFEKFARAYGEHTVLVIDTYDLDAAANKVVALASKLAPEDLRISGVRIDSGDLASEALKTRQILDAGGFPEIKIFVSGGLDETEIDRLVAGGAPIDGFGVGTSLVTSDDGPALDCAYKLQEYAGLPRRKKSAGKSTWPGRKQVYRIYGGDGRMAGDLLTTEWDQAIGEPLIHPVMRGGLANVPVPTLADARARAKAQLSQLPDRLQRLEMADYPVEVSRCLRYLARQTDQRASSEPLAGPSRPDIRH